MGAAGGGTLGALVLLSPWGLVVLAAAAVPAVALAVVVRRSRRAARALRLDPGAPWAPLAAGTAAVLGVALLALAAAQPAIETVQVRKVRSEAQAVFVVDVSRSMLAGSAPGAPTRLDKAREIARRLRAEIEDVPAGVAGMTDRVLPYLFPTADPRAFDLTVRRSVAIDAPPPSEVNTVATTFDALQSLAGNGWFAPSARRRACVLLTDGESRTGGSSDSGVVEVDPNASDEDIANAAIFGSSGGGGDGADIGATGDALGGGKGCRLIVVRVGGPGDRLRIAGKVEGQYRPDSTAASQVQELAQAAGGRAFGEGSEAQAGQALRAVVESGPTRRQEAGRALHRLAPWLALAGALLLGGLAAARAGRLRGPVVPQRP